MFWKIGFAQQSPSSFNESSVSSLYYSILIKCSKSGEIMLDSIFFTVLLKTVINEFSSVIASYAADFSLQLIFNNSGQFDEGIKSIFLTPQE